ncbi:hypothetical protein [Pseudomonas sp. G166]|uniref:hypothetical protein n=1 Tax=Pseudomonas sp. G166 TaxID=3094846 RepID=UPI0030096BF5
MGVFDGLHQGFEDLAADGLPGFLDRGRALQFVTLGNGQEAKQIVPLRRVLQHFVNFLFECCQAVEFFDSTKMRVEKRGLDVWRVGPCQGAQGKAAGQGDRRVTLGFKQQRFGAHRRGLRGAQRVVGQGRVVQPIEVCLRQPMGIGQLLQALGGQYLGKQKGWGLSGHRRFSLKAPVGGACVDEAATLGNGE